ncbi:unnamed protein product [Peniophora sp. CBMAI 1063]|nr:unnamed protein product [Peniophora sp. CBMAI 1063]
MSLFEVPGWSVPSAPVQESKKRKRPSRAAEGDEKVRGVEVNLEKLVKKMDSISGEADGRKKKKAKREDGEGAANARSNGAGEGKKTRKDAGKAKEQVISEALAKQGEKRTAKAEKTQATAPSQPESTTPAVAPLSKKAKKAARAAAKAEQPTPSREAKAPTTKKQNGGAFKDLTALQSGMKNSLEGARFRWINEELYKSDSTHAHEMMREDPNVFHEYHKGFRHQVESWPSNPVSHYIDELSSYPSKTVIADLGCGDAALARALIPRGFTVLSYDLVSDGAFVTEADIFGRLPLPGTLPEDDGSKHDGEAQVVDVVVCALSLMGTNWPLCVREAWRVLRSSGELKIAEVASRFTDVEAFKSLVSSCGFKLTSTDDSNSHFTLFEFKKVATKCRSDKEWEKLVAKGSLLKPCEYKRR